MFVSIFYFSFCSKLYSLTKAFWMFCSIIEWNLLKLISILHKQESHEQDFLGYIKINSLCAKCLNSSHLEKTISNTYLYVELENSQDISISFA